MKTQNDNSVKPEVGNSTKPLLSSRLFKFRAWVRNEIMVNVVSIDFNNEFITWDDNQYDRCVPPNKCYEIETFDEVVLMQFTGFKDKSGNEIYEGDIVFNHAENGVCNSNIIIFNEYGYFLQTYFSETRREIISLNEYLTRDLEVIGNIFQNPELL